MKCQNLRLLCGHSVSDQAFIPPLKEWAFPLENAVTEFDFAGDSPCELEPERKDVRCWIFFI